MKDFIFKYYPIIIAFIAMLYSIGLGFQEILNQLSIQLIGQEQYYYLQLQ